MNLDAALHTFIVESRELLADMENALLSHGAGAASGDMVHAVFRAAHTIKGSAGLFGLDDIVAFTHVVESVLDAVRDGAVAVDGELIAVLLSCCDHISGLIDALDGGVPAAASAERGAMLLAQLQRYQATGGEGSWHIALQFGRDVLRNGFDPLSFIRYLGQLGTITAIATSADGMPDGADMDAESCYLGFEITLRSAASLDAIENVFEFVRDDCSVRVAAANGLLATSAAPLAVSEPPKQAPSADSRSIRVDADKLEHLINLVGELIIAGASANLSARRARNAELMERTATLSGLVEQVRDSALQLRMVKIGATFNRFQRVVHDVAKDIGKDIALAVSGGESELDKTVVEKIGDPLTHLVRNAIDHGIEAAALREARGKPARGTVSLNAYHDSGCIVIEVADDGGGLKRDRILAKAIERGLVEPGRQLADSEIYNLVFEPGFSTAEQVTNLSGRGVGMDVVKRNITALRGSVGIDSAEGVGTTVTVRLPLTLAIIDGFLVAVGKSMYVIPLEMIEECLAFSAEPGHDYTNLRGEVLPFVRLRELFGVEGACARRENIVVVKHGGQRAGLVVDTLLGEFQTVIKPLNKLFSQVRCISGSTILGSGEVALILDMPALFGQIEHSSVRQRVA